MRILIYGLNFAPELVGIGRYTGEMAYWLAEQGHDVQVVCARPYYPDPKLFPRARSWGYTRETRHGVRVLRCPLWVSKRPGGMRRIVHLLSFVATSAIPLIWQSRRRPDLVLTVEPTLFGALPALLCARMARARAWLHVQDFEIDAAFGLGLLSARRLRSAAEAAERRLMSRFDRVSAISDRMVQHAQRKTGGAVPCLLFPNWVDTTQIRPCRRPSPLRTELDIPAEQRVLLYAGSMGEKQGVEILVAAARRLQRDDPSLCFVVASAGATFERLRAGAGGLGNIRWLPLAPEPDLNALLNLADIHLLPQKAGAADSVMPSKLTGMLASGRPVIATAAPGTQIAILLRDAGLTVEPDSVDALVDGIRRLAAAPELRRKLGQNARALAVALLDRERVLREFERELGALLGRQPDTLTDAV